MKEKAISIKQPWAYLICAGIKDIENRTWRLPEKYKGERVFIQASAAKCEFNFTSKQYELFRKLNMRRWYNNDFYKSAIIGSVRFVDCVINHPSIWAEKSEVGQDEQTNEWFKPIYNWVAADPILFDEPILNVKGKLSFWDCSEYINQIEK